MKSGKMKSKAQVSVEFITLAGFMFLLFTSLFFALQERLGTYRQAQTMESLMELGNKVSSEVSLAATVGPGYERKFNVPVTIRGGNYFIDIEGGYDLVVEYENLEHVSFLDTGTGNPIAGNIQKGQNTIRNEAGTIRLNP